MKLPASCNYLLCSLLHHVHWHMTLVSTSILTIWRLLHKKCSVPASKRPIN